MGLLAPAPPGLLSAPYDDVNGLVGDLAQLRAANAAPPAVAVLSLWKR